MKYCYYLVSAFIFCIIISSCHSSKETTRKDSAVKTSTSGVEKSQVTSDSGSVKPAVRERKRPSQFTGDMTGSQILENAINKLSDKLTLREDQRPNLKRILSETFTAIGENPGKTYTAEHAKEIHRNLIKKSSEALLPFLDDNQKTKFSNMLQHQ